MFFTRKPYQIDSVYYVDNTLRIGCDCQAFSETLTGCKDCFKDAKGRITVSVFSPASNIISIKVLSHHAEPKTKGYSVIELSPSGFGTLDDSGEYFVFKSGHLEARISKKIFEIKFFYCGTELLKQNANMPIYYKTDSGSESYYTLSSNAILGASVDLKPKENIYGLGGAGASIIRNGQIVKCNTIESRAGAEHIPFILSGSRYGLFVNTNRPVTFDVGSDSGTLNFEVEGEELEYSIIAGDTSMQILEIFSQLNGRIPALSYSTGGISVALNDDEKLTAQQILDAVKNARAAGVNIKELWIGNSWRPDYAPYGFTFDAVRFPDPGGFAKTIADMGIILGLSVNPFISERAPEFIELNIPEARSWFINACSALAREGFSVFESNYTYSMTQAFEKACGKRDYLLNFTSILNSALSDVSARERGRYGSFIIADSISSGDQQSPYSNIYTTLKADYCDLNAAIKNAVSYGLTGFGGLNIDIPEQELNDPRLFDRYVGFASYVPHSRFKGTLRFLENARTLESLKAFSAIRTGLAPYNYSSLCESVKYGTPVIRAMSLEFTGDPVAETIDSQYMLGASLLVTPVVTPGDSVRVYIPAGIWTDFMTHEKIQGPRFITRKVIANSVPVFARPNSIIPTRTPDSNSGIGSLDNLTFTCFGLSQGAPAACEVFADGGQASGIISAEVSGNKIIVRTQNLGGTKHLILSGIFNVVGLSESVPEKLSYGTSIEFLSNELVISLG